MIAILDYGAGNLRSVENTLEAVGARYRIVRDPGGVLEAEKVILPGVGHFGQMMRALDGLGVRRALCDAIRRGTPFLGICLGLQALFEASDEAPGVLGLGLFEGVVRRFSPEVRVPHMGWNRVAWAGAPRLMAGLANNSYVYFAHSYYVPVNPATAATCTYSVPYTAVLEQANTFGVQFHPEKSGPLGLAVMRNFVELQ